jgi:hypothetical protein
MTQITLDREIVRQTCSHCQTKFLICRGSVYDEGKPFAIYLAALHCCQPGSLVNLVISIAKGNHSLKENTAVALNITPMESENQFRIVEPHDSPWISEKYLGRILRRKEAQASRLKYVYFHIADNIIEEIPEIKNYLNGSL